MPSGSQVTELQRTLAISYDLEEGKRNLDEVGYTIHKNYLSAQQVEVLRSRLVEQAELELEADVATVSSSGHAGKDRHYGGRDGKAPPISQQVSFLPNKGAEFRPLIHHPIGLAYSEHVFRGVPFNLATQSGLFLRKGGKRQVLHADQQAWPFETPIPVMINILIALSDYDADMGATNVVPGSHRFPSPDLEMSAEESAASIGSTLIPMVCKAGDAMVFESRTWHCQGASTSDKTRIALGTVFAMHMVKPQDFYPAVIHDKVYDELSEADKDMLGFKVHFEYAGRIGPRHPGDTRANTNCRHPYIPELRRDGAGGSAVPYDDMKVAQTAVHAHNVA